MTHTFRIMAEASDRTESVITGPGKGTLVAFALKERSAVLGILLPRWGPRPESAGPWKAWGLEQALAKVRERVDTATCTTSDMNNGLLCIALH